MLPSKLKRAPPAQAPQDRGPEVDASARLEDLLCEKAFEQALDNGAWWGAPLGDRGQAEIHQAMESIAQDGSRCAWVAARSGPVGYWALLVHPADVKRWPGRWVSRSSVAKSSPHEPRLLFAPMGAADFPRGPPHVFSTNEAAALAWSERGWIEQALEAPARRGGSSGGGRL
jgi:hypothetical protein